MRGSGRGGSLLGSGGSRPPRVRARAPGALATCLPSPISSMGNQRRRRAGGPGRGSGAIGGAVHRNRGMGVQRLFLRPPGVATSLGRFGRRSRLLPPGRPARDRRAICGRSPAGPAPCAVRADWARPVGAGATGPARGPARSHSLRRGWGLPRARGPEGRCRKPGGERDPLGKPGSAAAHGAHGRGAPWAADAESAEGGSGRRLCTGRLDPVGV